MRFLLLAAIAALCAGPAAAQLSVELRGGAGAGAHEGTRAGFQAEPGSAISLRAGFAPVPAAELYVGYSRTAFGCAEGFCEGIEPTFTSRGGEAGVRLALPLRIWVRGGIALQTLAVTGTRDETPFSESADRAVGVAAGAGLGLPVSTRISLTPGIGYLRFRARTQGAEDAVAVLTGDLGVRIRF